MHPFCRIYSAGSILRVPFCRIHSAGSIPPAESKLCPFVSGPRGEPTSSATARGSIGPLARGDEGGGSFEAANTRPDPAVCLRSLACSPGNGPRFPCAAQFRGAVRQLAPLCASSHRCISSRSRQFAPARTRLHQLAFTPACVSSHPFGSDSPLCDTLCEMSYNTERFSSHSRSGYTILRTKSAASAPARYMLYEKSHNMTSNRAQSRPLVRFIAQTETFARNPHPGSLPETFTWAFVQNIAETSTVSLHRIPQARHIDACTIII